MSAQNVLPTRASRGPTLALVLISAVGLSVSALAQTEKVLYSFTPGRTGNRPIGSLVFDPAGNLYGLAKMGGDLRVCEGNGCGVIFKLSPTSQGWQESVVYSFSSKIDDDFVTGLALAPNGIFYGAGVWHDTSQAVLSFTSNSDDLLREDLVYPLPAELLGANPLLSGDSAGNLYDTSEYGTSGESNLCNTYNCGAAFKLTPTAGGWSAEILHQFALCPSTDGIWPISPFVADEAGNLYGTTEYGGSTQNCGFYGYGTVYELSPTVNGWTEQILYNFTNSRDGGEPTATLVRDKAGNLYGLASTGGAHGQGALYKLSNSGGVWTETMLYSFLGQHDELPLDPLIMDDAGNLYGATAQGGPYKAGTVIKLSAGPTGWTETTLYTFTGGSDGSMPRGGLTLDANGNLYGTTYRGGVEPFLGVVFEVTP